MENLDLTAVTRMGLILAHLLAFAAAFAAVAFGDFAIFYRRRVNIELLTKAANGVTLALIEPFSMDAARRLARSLSTYRRTPVESSPRSLPSKASVASMAATSAGVKTSSRGKSSGHSTRSASLSQRVASSASILG